MLTRHVDAIHKKLLRFICQFEGCNMAYSHSATLSKHQKMQHKATYHEIARRERGKQSRDGQVCEDKKVK